MAYDYFESFTITGYTPFWNFKKTASLTLVNDKTGKSSEVNIRASRIRAIANRLLGKNSHSLTEIHDTFANFAINGKYIRHSYYDHNYKPAKYKTGWCIL